MTVKIINEKRRKISEGNHKYIDTSFVLGSVAKVERLRSMVKFGLSDCRKRSTPLLIEAISFLKMNREFRNLQLTCEAMARFIN